MNEANRLSEAMADAVAAASAGVVHLEGRCGGSTATVWSADGALVTALHAIGPAEGARAHLADGRVFDARVVGRDPGTDLAALRIDAAELPTLAWDEGAALRVGNLVTPLGRPGLALRATLGMVSALGDAFRTQQGGTIDRHIEVDGSLPRGFSGGPLVDTAGRAIGINTAALVRGGVTIPTATLRRVVPALLAGGRVGRGYLGVGVHPVRVPEAVASSTAQRWGLMVVSLEPSAPAARGGLHVGDVILAVEDVAVQHPGDLVAALGGRVGETLRFRVARAGRLEELPLVVGARDD